MKHIVSLIAVLSVVILALVSIATAQVPNQMQYQGYLTDESGPLDTTVSMFFAIYDDSTGGMEIWSETQDSVIVTDGLFSVLLGSVNPITDDVVADSVRWLGITVGNDSEIRPRTRLVTVPYASRVSTVDGATAGHIYGGLYIHAGPEVKGEPYVQVGDLVGASGLLEVTDGTQNTIIANGVTGDFSTDGTVEMTGFKLPTGATDGYVLTSDGSGVGTWQAATGGADTDWSFNLSDGSDTTLTTGGAWGIARYGNTLYGNADSTHINLGVACTTGATGLNYKYCTVGGGLGNTAKGYNATVGGGNSNLASDFAATVGGGYVNTANANYATVGGGRDNTASETWATVGGGAYDTASGDNATVGGGKHNLASGSGATVGGGDHNTASGMNATVGGGYNNTADTNYATVGGGYFNLASRWGATVGGGTYDTASGDWATVGGGSYNTASEHFATVGGGADNAASAYGATVGGGCGNTADSNYATVGGGHYNLASHVGATVGGGYVNTANTNYATVGGGYVNTASGNWATVGGGDHNTASAHFATVGGGGYNTASGSDATVGGGTHNIASVSDATVGGGHYNLASHIGATVGGGIYDTASGAFATVGGGDHNTASGMNATVGGGYVNTASGDSSTVGGGTKNTAKGSTSTVGGGYINTASGTYGTVPGGRLNAASGDYSFAAGNNAKANHNGSVVIAANSSGVKADSVRSGGSEQMVLRADGGIYVTNVNELAPYDNSNIITTRGGAYLSGTGGTWTDASDRNLKENFTSVDGLDILEKLRTLPITEWNYIAEGEGVRRIGPMGQDFFRIFGIGKDEKSISSRDLAGIALAAIQELHKTQQELFTTQQELKGKVEEISLLRMQLQETNVKLSELSAMVQVILAKQNDSQSGDNKLAINR